jgi:hypothetical protein
MPNWCNGSLIVSGDPLRLKEFMMVAVGKDKKGSVLSEEGFIPYPKEWTDLDKKHPNESKSFNLKKEDKTPVIDGCVNGYDWCNKMWGTKWGFCDTEIDDSCIKDGEIVYNFQTAWGPADPLVRKMGEMFPDLRFEYTYDEPGMCFEGTLIMENGECVEDECREMDMSEYEDED